MGLWRGTKLHCDSGTKASKETDYYSLGGLEDVNELRGHRRTYIGAMPGRITQGLIEQTSNHSVLDEIVRLNRGL